MGTLDATQPPAEHPESCLEFETLPGEARHSAVVVQSAEA